MTFNRYLSLNNIEMHMYDSLEFALTTIYKRQIADTILIDLKPKIKDYIETIKSISNEISKDDILNYKSALYSQVYTSISKLDALDEDTIKTQTKFITNILNDKMLNYLSEYKRKECLK